MYIHRVTLRQTECLFWNQRIERHRLYRHLISLSRVLREQDTLWLRAWWVSVGMENLPLSSRWKIRHHPWRIAISVFTVTFHLHERMSRVTLRAEMALIIAHQLVPCVSNQLLSLTGVSSCLFETKLRRRDCFEHDAVVCSRNLRRFRLETLVRINTRKLRNARSLSTLGKI